MPDFRDYDDVIWASASTSLGLAMFDADGKLVPPREGDRSHAMRGRLGDLDALVRVPRARGADRCVVEISFPMNLLLGLRWRYGGELTDLTPPILLHFTVDGADRERARRLATKTAASAKIEDAIRALGFVHAEITDTSVRISRFGSPEGPGFYVDCVRAAERGAHWVMEGRKEIGDSPWEREVREELDNAAAAFGVDVDPARLSLRGSIGGATLALDLRATPSRYEVDLTLLGRGSSELAIETRASRKGHTLHDLFHRHSTGDAAFDRAFAVDGTPQSIAKRCTPDVRAALLGLGADRLSYDARGLHVVAPLMPLLAVESPSGRTRLARFIERVAGVARALLGAPPSTPYR
ncbi:MAG: hypothetical protein U0414_11885 [Polyangiaceae bacterium]